MREYLGIDKCKRRNSWYRKRKSRKDEEEQNLVLLKRPVNDITHDKPAEGKQGVHFTCSRAEWKSGKSIIKTLPISWASLVAQR